MALSLSEFLRRYVQHVLPDGFVRIRQFGFLANRHRTDAIRGFSSGSCHMVSAGRSSPFGVRIPDQPQMVEFVEVGNANQVDRYSRYAGSDLSLAPLENKAAQERVRFILSLTKAKLP